MTISYVNTGDTVAGASTITPGYFTAPTVGQLGILQVASGHPSDSIPSTPSGWTLAGSFSGGGGAFGAGTGPRRLSWFVREMTGGDAAPTTAIPSGGTGSVIAGAVTLLSRSAGTGWRWAVSFGEDTSSGTAFSVVGTANETWATGDFAWIGYVLPLSTATLSAQAVAASGITFGAASSKYSIAVATGNALRIAAASAAVSSGTGSGTPTVSATLSAATTGVASVLRIREATAALTVTAQNVFPPRNLLSITGMTAGDITSVTINRQVNGTLTPVRAAINVNVTGQNALVRVDGEQPFGIAINYQAVLTDINGNAWTIYSPTITSTVTSDVVSDAIRGVGAAVHIESWPEKRRSRDATVFNVGGRLVVVGKPRSTPQSTVTVSTDTTADGDALQAVLDDLTEGVLLIRAQTTDARIDSYLAHIEDTEKPNWQTQYSEWDLSVAESQPWADLLEAAGFSLQDIANNFTSLQDTANAYATLLAIAQADFGG